MNITALFYNMPISLHSDKICANFISQEKILKMSKAIRKLRKNELKREFDSNRKLNKSDIK